MFGVERQETNVIRSLIVLPLFNKYYIKTARITSRLQVVINQGNHSISSVFPFLQYFGTSL
jgi:hypothetical protein